ncbi:haloacid dehalogenase type II [Flavisolibacter ginsenosidimutans]|uniref:Haloacid dehalogenase type II n=1 Tax=Flavisolibacter ginsenosidimutans TaxID=661481 RepID=A0A5B8UI88_9BACT|nr:haloacid dehalogenase type II [Flavisolibacter ginsenosidimutans]QEC56152.1 haloacid dehalogenase type II [Flavisolibacter ginsenosidimutans]
MSTSLASLNGTSLPLPKVVLFDVYETLLDMQYIKQKINSLLSNKWAYRYWFELLMQYCLVENSIGTFHPFAAIAKETLKKTALPFGHRLYDEEIEELLGLFDHLPVNEGVTECLSLLADHNCRIAALTNTSEQIICDRMERTGLISYFEAVFSAEEVKKYKPATEVYTWTLRQLNVQPEEVLYVSTQDWDVAGAASAGMMTAYIEPENSLFYSLATPPNIRVQHFEAFVNLFAKADV